MLKAKKKRGSAQVCDKYRLDRKDRLLIRRVIEHPATPVRELATLLGVSATAVKNRMKKPSFTQAYAEVTQSTDAALKALAQTAIQRVISLIESSDKQASLEACKVILMQHMNRS